MESITRCKTIAFKFNLCFEISRSGMDRGFASTLQLRPSSRFYRNPRMIDKRFTRGNLTGDTSLKLRRTRQGHQAPFPRHRHRNSSLGFICPASTNLEIVVSAFTNTA